MITSAKKAKAKTPVLGLATMLQLRALSMMPRKARMLMGDQFDDKGRLLPKTEDMTADALFARKEYCRYYLALEKWYGKRFDDGVITYSLPDYIALQPDLAESEKRLLADVDFFKGTDEGCFKSNDAFAVELATTEAAIKNMISRLIKAGFLSRELKGGRRILKVTIGEHKNVNKENRSPQCDHPKSPQSDPQVTAKCSAGHRNVPERSPESDQKIVNKAGPEPVIIDQNDSQPSRHPSGDENKTTTTTGPSARPSSSFLKSAEGCRPQTPTSSLNTKPGWKEPFLKLHQIVFQHRFDTEPKLKPEDERACEAFFSENPSWKPLPVITVLTLSWEKVGVTADNGYRYPACQGTKSVSHFFKHFDLILRDTDGAWCQRSSGSELLDEITASLEEQLKDLPENELSEKLERVEDEFHSALGQEAFSSPARKKPTGGGIKKVPVKCGKCGHQFEIFEDGIEATCPKCRATVPGPQLWLKA